MGVSLFRRRKKIPKTHSFDAENSIFQKKQVFFAYKVLKINCGLWVGILIGYIKMP